MLLRSKTIIPAVQFSTFTLHPANRSKVNKSVINVKISGILIEMDVYSGTKNLQSSYQCLSRNYLVCKLQFSTVSLQQHDKHPQ